MGYFLKMNEFRLNKTFLIKGITPVIGLGLAWISVRMIRNEKRLLLRRLELEAALLEKCDKKRKKLLID